LRIRMPKHSSLFRISLIALVGQIRHEELCPLDLQPTSSASILSTKLGLTPQQTRRTAGQRTPCEFRQRTSVA